MRVRQLKDSLNNSENLLKDFRDQNRVILQSPSLLLEQGRLERNVDILQTVYVELTKQLEIAKIDEIKNTPVLNIREQVNEPVSSAGPKRRSTLMVIMFFSLFFSISYFIFEEKLKTYTKLFKAKWSEK